MTTVSGGPTAYARPQRFDKILPFETGVGSGGVIFVSDSEFWHGFLLSIAIVKAGAAKLSWRRQNACLNTTFMYLDV